MVEREYPFIGMAPPLHPGQILERELANLGVTPTELARQIGVPANRVTQIIQGKRAITGDTALRLGHWFGVDPHLWINLQAAHDLRVAGAQSGAEIARRPTKAHRAGHGPAKSARAG